MTDKASVKAPGDVDAEAGRRVRLRRTMIKLSQEKLADALGVTFQQVQKYENGTNRISASRLQRIAQVLGVQIEYFFSAGAGSGEGATKGQSPTESNVPLITGEALSLLRSFQAISDRRTRKRFAVLVKAVAKGQIISG